MSNQLSSSLPFVSGFTDLSNVRIVFAEGRTLYQGPASAFLSSSTQFQPLDATLTALAELDSNEGVVYQSGADTFDKIGIADIPWLAQPLGKPTPIMTDITGFDAPPTNSSLYRYVELTAGLTGSGGYNEGCLASESVTGSSPLVQATAVISLAASPAYGQTIHLINTEEAFLRGSATPGTLQMDQMQQITGSIEFRRLNGGQVIGDAYDSFTWINGGAAGTGNSINAGTSTAYNNDLVSFDSADSPNARTGTETRPKNLGVKYFVRIL